MTDNTLIAKLLSQCGVKITFNMAWPEDTEICARVWFAGNYEFRPLTQIQERHETHWITLDEESESVNVMEKEETSKGKTQSSTVTNTKTETDSVQTNFSDGTSDQHSSSTGGSASESQDKAFQITGRGKAKNDSTSDATGESHVKGGGTGKAVGIASGTSQADGTSEGQSHGKAVGMAKSVSHKKMQITDIIPTEVPTGQMEKAFNDQLETFKQRIACLPKRHAIVRVPDERKAFEIVTADVPDAFRSAEAQVRAVEWVKRELAAIHPYYFVPDLSPDEERRRIEAFLGDAPAEDEVEVVEVVEDEPFVAEEQPPGAPQHRSARRLPGANGNPANPFD